MNILETYKLFESRFNGQVLAIETNFKRFPIFYIKFSTNQLPHLLGLHKLYSYPPKEMIEQIKCGNINYSDVKKHKNFGDIKDRLLCFNFFIDTFLNDLNSVIIVVSESDNCNSMKLDLVFKGEKYGRKEIIGLRKSNKEADMFSPVTFFATKNKKFDYQHSSKIKIEKKYWL